MNYITIDQNNLELSLSESEPKSGFLIPTKYSDHDVLERDFHGLVYFGVLYPYIEGKDMAKGKLKISFRSYLLAKPDPWLIALAAIMWQGLIQGFTWDMIKLSALRGIRFLRSKSLLAKELYPRDGWKKSKKKRKRV